MKHFLLAFSLCVFTFLIVSAPLNVQAQTNLTPEQRLGLEYGEYSGLGTTDVRTTVAKIINAALGLLGTVCVVLIVYAGIKYMTSGGDESKMKDATKVIMGAILGLLIIMSAYAISTYITKNIYEATVVGDIPRQ